MAVRYNADSAFVADETAGNLHEQETIIANHVDTDVVGLVGSGTDISAIILSTDSDVSLMESEFSVSLTEQQ